MIKPHVNQLKRFVGNDKVYALQNTEGAWFPVDEPLNHQILQAHSKGELTVGTYLLDGDQARMLVFDLDDSDLNVAEDAASRVEGALRHLGVPTLSTGREFSGKKGYHVWVVLAGYVEAKELRRLGRAVIGAAGIKCEVFPKQDFAKNYGNLVKLPGGIHRVTGNANDFIDRVPRPMSLQVLDGILESLPPEPERTTSGRGPEPIPCMAAIQDGVVEGGRNISLFHLAVLCRRGGLTDENVAEVVRRANARCVDGTGELDPLPDHEVDALLDSSRDSGPICSQLDESIHCGDCCLLARAPGLYTRKGQLRYATPGEKVVLEIGERRGKVVELVHEDVAQSKVVLS